MKKATLLVLGCLLAMACGTKTTNETGETKSLGEAEGAVMMTEDNFPDVNLRKAICLVLPVAEGDAMPRQILEQVKKLNLSALGIANLKGIEHLANLEQLSCDNNRLVEIDVSRNTKLRALECGNNQLTVLDVSHNPHLEGLGCSNNQLTSIDISKNPELERLLCNGNKIGQIDVSHNPALRELGVVNCGLKSLDLTANHKLKELYCSGNKISRLDLSNNTEMENLFFQKGIMEKTEIIYPENNPDLDKGPTNTWADHLTLFW